MKPEYAPETELIYRAECTGCDEWFVPSNTTDLDQRTGLRRAKAWARQHIEYEHPDEQESVYAQIWRVTGNVA